MGQGTCINCGLKPQRGPFSRECEACARYRKRNGKNRPDHLIRRAWERDQEQALAAVDDPDESPPCSVYRAYDETGQLLYVGITETGVSRLDSHRLHSAWWPLTTRIELDHYPDRACARSVEAAIIDVWHPPYNAAA